MKMEDVKIKFIDKKVILKNINEKDAKRKGLEELGEAFGLNVGFCAWIGSRYSKDFKNKVKYYQIIKNDIQKFGTKKINGGVRVKFYAEGGKDKILSQIRSMILVEELMVKELFFFKNREESKEFCLRRDIEKVPIKNSTKYYMFFNKQTKRFTKKKFKKEDTISAKSNLSELIDKTKKRDLLFVLDNKKLVGVIHFCDLISSTAYIYFYSILNVFERLLREKLILIKKEDKDILLFLKNRESSNKEKLEKLEKNIYEQKLPPFQHIELRDLLYYSLSEKAISLQYTSKKELKKGIQKIIDFRNTVMHNKDFSSRQDSGNIPSEMLYERKDYNKFLEAYDILISFIKELNKKD